jgi:hypothetical protein
VLIVGTPRVLVLGELGQPVLTETKNGLKSDIFNFTQGYHKGIRVGRVVFHAVADVLTCGLWEVAGTPVEAVFDGTKVQYRIDYDSSDKVMKIISLSRKS